jgi:hypothetical protein
MPPSGSGVVGDDHSATATATLLRKKTRGENSQEWDSTRYWQARQSDGSCCRSGAECPERCVRVSAHAASHRAAAEAAP